MSSAATRFTRLRAGAAGGTKLCGRREVNPALSPQQANDDASFRQRLEQRFGPSDPAGDGRFSYCVRDEQSGIEFEAYSAGSGPAYGGDLDLFESLPDGGLRLRAEPRRVLGEFEAWLVQASAT